MRRKTFNLKAFGRIGALGAALLLVACAGPDEPPPMKDMEQHAPELEEMIAGMRDHIPHMQALRMDTERLQTASVGEVRERMSPHLERLERMARVMDRSAGHMRSM